MPSIPTTKLYELIKPPQKHKPLPNKQATQNREPAAEAVELIFTKLDELEREETIRLIFEAGQRRGEAEKARLERRENQIKKATVPVRLRVERRVYDTPPPNSSNSSNSRRDGRTFGIVFRDFDIVTLLEPAGGVPLTTFSSLDQKVRQIYEKGFGGAHCWHRHPSPQHGDINMEGFVILHQYLTKKKVREENWFEILADLTMNRMLAEKKGKADLSTATVVARITCPLSSTTGWAWLMAELAE